MIEGVVSYVDEERGFGFLLPRGSAGRLFFKVRDVAGQTVARCDDVTFEIGEHSGRRVARSVKRTGTQTSLEASSLVYDRDPNAGVLEGEIVQYSIPNGYGWIRLDNGEKVWVGAKSLRSSGVRVIPGDRVQFYIGIRRGRTVSEAVEIKIVGAGNGKLVVGTTVTGQIIAWTDAKSCGFAEIDGGKGRIFVHARARADRSAVLDKGTRIMCHVAERTGQIEAADVQVINSSQQ